MKCRHCGSEKVRSQGRNIKCEDCGRVSAKIPRWSTPSLSERPPCPDCGSREPYSLGPRVGERSWACKSCGRVYTERSLEVKVEIPILEVQVE